VTPPDSTAGPAPDPQALAEAAAAAMYAEDKASQGLGMVVESMAPGQATLSMTVREDMVNGHGICHGGFIFTLADSCFAFACNSHNRVTVAQSASIDFLAPARLGDALTAMGEERALGGRTGVYDIVVSKQDGTRIALFRGKSYRIQGTLVPDA
jgi:acyl-CoA thioesterase